MTSSVLCLDPKNHFWTCYSRCKFRCHDLNILGVKDPPALVPEDPPPPQDMHDFTIFDEMVNCSSTVKDIGVVLDDSMSTVPHITAVCKSAFFHLRNIFKIRKFLTTETTKTLLHAFVTSKIDYCNSLLYGAPKYLLHRLQ